MQIQYTTDELSKEIWKAFVNSNYQISNLGRIKNRKTNRFLKVRKGRSNYLEVTLWIEKKNKNFTVHKLVALLFLGERPKGKEVNHIDLNKLNPRLSNLEYLTHQENMKHAGKSGVMGKWKGEHWLKRHPEKIKGEKHPNAKLNDETVLLIRQMFDNRGKVKKYAMYDTLGKLFGVAPGVVERIVNRRAWTHI